MRHNHIFLETTTSSVHNDLYYVALPIQSPVEPWELKSQDWSTKVFYANWLNLSMIFALLITDKKKKVILELKKIFWKNYHQILQILQSCDICWRKGCTLFSVSWDESLIHSRKWFGHYQFIILMQRRIHMVLGLLAYSFTNLWSVTEILYIKLGKGFPSFSMLQTDYWCK